MLPLMRAWREPFGDGGEKLPDEVGGKLERPVVAPHPGLVGSPEVPLGMPHRVRLFLATHEAPKAIEFIDALPMGITGKVQRRVLRAKQKNIQGSAQGKQR